MSIHWNKETRMSEKHPWDQDYQTSYKTYDDPTMDMILNISLEQIQLFRLKSEYWAENRRTTHNSRKCVSKTFEFSNDLPNEPFALYSVVSNPGGALLLTPMHCEVAANDRADLQIIRLSESAIDTLNGGRIDFERFPPGCILCVTKLQMLHGRNLEDISFDSDISEKPCWEVSRFFPCEQQFVENVLTIPYEHSLSLGGYFNCVTPQFNHIMRCKTNIAPKTMTNGSMWSATVFKPCLEPNLRLSGYQKRSNLQKRPGRRILNLLCEHRILPSIVYVCEISVVKCNMFDNYKKAFENYYLTTAYQNIEDVVLFGQHGIQTIRNNAIDRTVYSIDINPVILQNPWLIFKFRLPHGVNNASIKKWSRPQRIRISGESNSVKGEIVGAIQEDDSTLVVTARILSSSAKKFQKMHLDGRRSLEVVQMKDRMPIQIRKWNEQLQSGSNGDRLIKALYGDRPIESFQLDEVDRIALQFNGDFYAMIQSQMEYIRFLADLKTVAFLAAGTFGCGMTTAMAIATIHMSRKFEGLNIVVAPNENEAASFIRTLKKLDQDSEARLIRLVSKKRRDEMEPEKITKYDYPSIMPKFFQEFISKNDCAEEMSDELGYEINQMMKYLKKKKLMPVDSLSQKMKEMFLSNSSCRENVVDEKEELAEDEKYVDLYMKHSNTKIIVATPQFLIEAFSSSWKSKIGCVTTVQIDKAPSLPQATICQLAVLFQNGRFSLVGDLQNHEQRFRDEVPFILRDAVAGISMKELKKNKCLPFVAFDFNFRCHPLINELLANIFYNNMQLYSDRRDSEIDQKLREKGIIPDTSYPVAIIHNDSKHEIYENSVVNSKEQKITKSLVRELLPIVINPAKIGVLCFFETQKNSLYNWACTIGVNLLMVDEAQRREFEVVIVLTTKTGDIGDCQELNDEMRIKVALSRSKGTVFVLGQVFDLREHRKWWKIIRPSTEQSAVCDIRESRIDRFRDSVMDVHINFDWKNMSIENPRKRNIHERITWRTNGFEDVNRATLPRKRKNQESLKQWYPREVDMRNTKRRDWEDDDRY